MCVKTPILTKVCHISLIVKCVTIPGHGIILMKSHVSVSKEDVLGEALDCILRNKVWKRGG